MILFQNFDKKFESLHVELKKHAIMSHAISGSPLKAPFIIMAALIRGKKLHIYVFRYLNDYPSFFKSALRLLSEVMVIIICRIWGITLWWICHNVDKESHANFPRISLLRRRLVGFYSKRIFTTSHLLNKYAALYFNSSKISNISLGYIQGKVYSDLSDKENTNANLSLWLEKQKMNKCKIIFCVGTLSTKVLHFDLISSLVELLNKADKTYNWRAVVVGVSIPSSPHIYNIQYKHFVSSDIIQKYVDYYYRVMDDLSISYTLYEAAYFKKPTLTERYGFLPEIVSYYDIGFVIDRNDICSFLEWEKVNHEFGFSRFQNENNWREAAKTLSYYYEIDNKV